MTTRQYLRLLGEKDARAGKSINAFYDAPLAGHHRHNENARAEYEMGYRAAKQEMRKELRQKTELSPRPHWLEAAPQDDRERRDYFVSLVTLMSFRFTQNQMEEVVRRALEIVKGREGKPNATDVRQDD